MTAAPVAASPPPRRLTAWEATVRGVLNTRANWQLALMYLLQALAVTAVVLLGVGLLVVIVGWERWEGLEGWDPATGAEAWSDVLALSAELGLSLALGLLGAAFVWLLALILFSWFQGGFYGVLVAGDRQAPPGRVADPLAFRTFSLAHYAGWGGRYLWRYFWFWNLYSALVFAWMLLTALVVLGAVWGADRWGPPAAVGIGCGGALPLVFLIFVLALWSGLATAHLGQQGSGIRDAAKEGLSILGRRLGAVLLIYAGFLVLLMGFSYAVSLPLLPLTMGSMVLIEENVALFVAAQALGMLLQFAVSAAFTTAFTAVMVALVRAESPR